MVFLRRASHYLFLVTLFVYLQTFGCDLSTNAQQGEPQSAQQGGARGQNPTAAPANDPSSGNANQPRVNDQQQAAHDLSEFFLERLVDPVTWFTGFLVGLGVFQYLAMRRQADVTERQNTIIENQSTTLSQQEQHMRDGLAETRNSINEATKSATAMESIAASMAVNARFVEESIGVTKQMAQTNLTAFHAGNRGSMSVRPIRMDGFDHLGHLLSDITLPHIRITNVGAVDVTFLHFHARWLFSKALPVNNPAIRATDDTTDAAVVRPGYFTDKTIDTFPLDTDVRRLINENVDASYASQELPHQDSLYLFGYVKFKDSIGVRRSYFCCRYEPYLRGFAPVKHPQYDYEE